VLLIGYARVSKSDGSQTVAPQRNALLVAGVDPERIYEDLASGRNDARPGLIACLKALQPGNTLVLWKLDRLGRDLRHLVNTAEDLRVRGIGLKVLTGAGAQIDTTTANGRLAFGIFAAFAEFERELIAERTQAGLAAARARGRLGGRPRKMDRAMLTMAMAALSDPKAVAADVAKRLGITTTTLYTYVNGDGSPKAARSADLRASLAAAICSSVLSGSWRTRASSRRASSAACSCALASLCVKVCMAASWFSLSE
jgi:DNA invertase Pin-like site-specific DNA recombinase